MSIAWCLATTHLYLRAHEVPCSPADPVIWLLCFALCLKSRISESIIHSLSDNRISIIVVLMNAIQKVSQNLAYSASLSHLKRSQDQIQI
ncbi:hypothetical protein BDZ45DRAFT_85563 [Acephala macrosclerotiorum]|nr:hypothetical protein BDZ45DRAFT_85563 [Acephala macrosclerotiorum]